MYICGTFGFVTKSIKCAKEVQGAIKKLKLFELLSNYEIDTCVQYCLPNKCGKMQSCTAYRICLSL